ncbi:MAG: hypothetical protein AABX11_03495 [Nanoarchaeota archaeon]
MNDKSKENILKDFTKEQLIIVINEVNNKNPFFKQEIEKFIDKNKTNFEAKNNYSEYNALLGEAERIISDFDELGGGDEEDEHVVYDNLDNIASLFQQGKLDEKTKKEFIETCFEYYGGNSGFDDILRDSIFDVCTSKEDWLFVIEGLKKSGSDYDAECIINIYRDKLNDDKTYLKLRMNKLHFGMDYDNLVEYYNKKGYIEKAITTANEGIEKGEGRISDLIDFLLEFYSKKKDYENILKYKLLSFKNGSSFEEYREIIKFCNKTDSERVLNELKEIINLSRDEELKAEINYFNKDYPSVLEYVKNSFGYSFYEDKFRGWAQKLELHFPKDVSKIYLGRVMRILEHKLAKEYSSAGYYLKRIKIIFLNIEKNKKEWDILLYSLKQKSLKLPSFQKMLQEVEND